MLSSPEFDGSVVVEIYLFRYVMGFVLILVLLIWAYQIPSEGLDEK